MIRSSQAQHLTALDRTIPSYETGSYTYNSLDGFWHSETEENKWSSYIRTNNLKNLLIMLRNRVELTQKEAALHYFQMNRFQTYGSWERASEKEEKDAFIPDDSRRSEFLLYLADGLQLRNYPQKFNELWKVLSTVYSRNDQESEWAKKLSPQEEAEYLSSANNSLQGKIPDYFPPGVISRQFYDEAKELFLLQEGNWQITSPASPKELFKAKAVSAEEALVVAPFSFMVVNKNDSNNLIPLTPLRFLVYCLDTANSSLRTDQLEKFLDYLKSTGQPEIIQVLVTSKELDEHQKRLVTSYHSHLHCITRNRILNSILDFTRYDKYLISQYEGVVHQVSRLHAPPLGKVYIPLLGEEQQFAKIDSNFIAKNSSNPAWPTLPTENLMEAIHPTNEITWRGDLEKRIFEWLNDNDTTRLALIGSFGTGKSSLCKRVTHEMLRQSHPRKPILIRLSACGGRENNKISFDKLIENYLKESGLHNVTIQKLEKWAAAGRLLIIFEGFDELSSRSNDTLSLQANLSLLERWANIPNNKVMLTTRKEYFRTTREELTILKKYRRLYCYLLTKNQITDYLKKRVRLNVEEVSDGNWKLYQSAIERLYGLSSLQYRFVLLEMIIRTLPELIDRQSPQFSVANLYWTYLNMELADRKEQEQVPALQELSPKMRLALLEELAFQLYQHENRSNDQVFEADEAWDWLRPGVEQGIYYDLHRNWHSFLTYSFLSRVGESQFEFSHKSFFEYLVALRLDRQLRQNDFSGLAVRKINQQIADFLAELNPPVQILLKSVENPTTSVALLYSAGQLRLSLRLIELNRKILGEIYTRQGARSSGTVGAVGKAAITEKPDALIDSSYITCLEYYVFLEERLQEDCYHHPDHWLSLQPDYSRLNQPITGLLDLDGLAFCEWLNQRRNTAPVALDVRKDSVSPALVTTKTQDETTSYFTSDLDAAAELIGGVDYFYRLPQLTDFEVYGKILEKLTLDYPGLSPWVGSYPSFRMLRPEVGRNLLQLPIDMLELPLETLTCNALAIAYSFTRDLDLPLTEEIVQKLGSISAKTEILMTFGALMNFIFDYSHIGAINRTKTDKTDVTMAIAKARNYPVGHDLAYPLALILTEKFGFDEVLALLRLKLLNQALVAIQKLKQTFLTENGDTGAEYLTQIEVTLPLIEIANTQDAESYRQKQREYVGTYGKLSYAILENLNQIIEVGPENIQAVANLIWRDKLTKLRQTNPTFPVWETLLLALEIKDDLAA